MLHEPLATESRRDSWTVKLLGGKLISSFHDQIKPISGDVAEYLAAAAGPPHFETFGLRALRQPKVCTQVALREITATTGDLADLGDPACPQLDAGTLGTQACAEYVTKPEYVRELIKQLNTSGPGRKPELPAYYQVLLKVKINDSVPVQTSYVTHHVLE